MAYKLYILRHAQRDIKKLTSKALQRSIFDTCKQVLEVNPRPDGCEQVQGYRDVFRVYSEDRKYRIIYSVQEYLQAVIVISVRRRGESTYKHLPIRSLNDMVRDLQDELLGENSHS